MSVPHLKAFTSSPVAIVGSDELRVDISKQVSCGNKESEVYD
jgi:hypothetical protein